MMISPRKKTSEPAINVLANHGKSFRFAGRFLDKRQLHDCARLYRFCRFIDDMVDEASVTTAAREELERLKLQLNVGASSEPTIQDFIELKNQCGMQSMVVNELIRGIESDLNPVLIETESELLRYCYRVAGTVGLLMCDVLHVYDTRARAHAIDLGIAMQLTNIARDVKEDAELGRRYIPALWFGELKPKFVTKQSPLPTLSIKKSVKRLLGLADSYYESGKFGIRFLPPRAKHGIRIAALLYREIGVVIAERDYDVYRERVFVNLPRKLLVAIRATFSKNNDQPYLPHNSDLHIHLSGLPYSHEKPQ